MEKDLIYLAGFFDGEGSMGHYGKKHSKNERRYLMVSVAQIDRRPIDLMARYFGGTVRVLKSRLGYRNLWQLQYHSEKAKDVLANLYPYLLVKREQAAFALETT